MTKSNRYRSKRVIHITIRSSINDRSHKNLSSKIGRSIYTDTDRKPTTSISSKIAHSESEKDITYDHHRKLKKNKKYCQHCKLIIIILLLILIISIAIVIPLVFLLKPTKNIINKSAILRWNSTGITIAAGTGVYGTGSNQFQTPWDLTFDLSNTLYVTDRNNNRVQKFLIGSINGITILGQANGIAGSNLSDLSEPTGIQVDFNGNVYVADRNNTRILFLEKGTLSSRIVAGDGTFGSGNNQLNFPYGIECDFDSHTSYVSDRYNHRIMSYPLIGNVLGTLVAGGNGAGLNRNQLHSPPAFHIDSLSNSLIIANTGGNNIVRWIIGASNWTLVVGNSSEYPGNTASEFQDTADVTLDPMGNIYVSDYNNHRIQFFLRDQSIGKTIVGITSISGNNSTLLNRPISLKLDNQLNLHVVDCGNNRIQKFLRY